MKRYAMVVGLLALLFLTGGCSAGEAVDAAGGSNEHAGMAGMAGMSGQMGATEPTTAAGHAAADAHSAAAHGIPDEAAAVPNPVAVSDASVAAGQATYTQYCAACHGAQGEGDGAAAASLNPKPADFHAAHVQELPDGALFYTITHGREGTAMVAWESILSEQQRWEVVNFLRTFEAAEGH